MAKTIKDGTIYKYVKIIKVRKKGGNTLKICFFFKVISNEIKLRREI